jgi:hypothetical protein
MPTYTTTALQKEELLGRGYTALPEAIPAELLDRLQKMAERLEVKAMRDHENGTLTHAAVITDPVGNRLARYDDILREDPDTVLDLLASPAMMAVFRDLCGKNAAPIQVDILYKQQHPHPVVIWHQGAQHSRDYPYLNVGVYLDDAGFGDGCLRYLDGTQHELQDIQGLSEEHGWDIPGVVEMPAEAGDILVQDMMVLHGSQPKRTLGCRRTIYIEIRPIEAILESRAQSPEWAENRRRFMGLVLRRADHSDWPADWRSEYPDDLGCDTDEVALIMRDPEPPVPAVYATFPVAHEDYPVPSDMRDGDWPEKTG